MAFVRSPDNISIELLQKGSRLEPAEPWKSMQNVGPGNAPFYDKYDNTGCVQPLTGILTAIAITYDALPHVAAYP